MANYSSLESTYVCEEYWACKNAVDCYERITNFTIWWIRVLLLLQALKISKMVQKTSRPSEKSTLFYYSNLMSMFLWCLSLMDFIGMIDWSFQYMISYRPWYCDHIYKKDSNSTLHSVKSYLKILLSLYLSCNNSMFSTELQSKFPKTTK